MKAAIHSILALLAAIVGLAPASSPAADFLSLAGRWRFALDREDAGIAGQWWQRELEHEIRLPGALQSQGYGDLISVDTPWVLSLYDRSWHLRAEYQAYTNAGSVKVPFVCQPPRHYLGPAWYQRDIHIPGSWNGRRVVLFLERPRWETRVWLDDRLLGTNNSLCAPHEYDFGRVRPGKHRISIRIDNRMILPYRPDAHSVSDSLGSTWNGIAGALELRSTSPVWIDSAQIYPNAEQRSARVQLTIGSLTGKPGKGVIRLLSAAMPAPAAVPAAWGASGNDTNEPPALAPRTVECQVSFNRAAALWDEFHPALHRLRIELRGDDAEDWREIVFGLRDFRAQGERFLINGREVCLRGTHHGGDFPLTGYPPTDVEYWRKLMRTCQDWGLNHLRFHSWCPPEAAFVAADELGLYLQPECGMWNEITAGTPMERMMYDETDRIIKAYGNHPSFVLLSPSNEPRGRWKEALPRWVEQYRRTDPRRLYTTGTGWSLIDTPGPVAGAQYLAVGRIGMNRVRGESAWFGRDYDRSLTGVDVPVVSHELGQWCAYPDYDLIRKFTGYMRPGNYEIFRDSLAAHGLAAMHKDFALASGRFQLACYKEEIEANLRTRGLAGFQLLDLHDYVGQGTALVGLLDPFWESKLYVSPAEFRRFCGPTVPLVRLRQRVFTTAQKLEADAEVAHYGPNPLSAAPSGWRIVDGRGRAQASGEWPATTIPIGKRFPLGKITADLAPLAAPAQYRLVIKTGPAENDWNFWLYPADPPEPRAPDVLVTRSWDEAEAKLAGGARVLYVPRPADLDWTSPPLDNVPVFWNRLMNPGWSRMLGLWCQPGHPALAAFPTEAQCDWQWTQIVRQVRPVNLDRLPPGLEPIVYAIDDWNRNWKLGALFQCRVGPGRLMVCAFDIVTDLESRPVARQLRRSLLEYMNGPLFQPSVQVPATQFRTVLFDNRIMRRLGAAAEGADTDPANAIDGDPNTFWLAGGTGRGQSGKRHPHSLTIHFPAPVAMDGVLIMPRQNDRDHTGDIRDYTIEMSADGQQWREISRGVLASSWSPQTVRFPRPTTAAHLRLTALSGFGADASAALAELAVLHAGPGPAGSDPASPEYRRVHSTSADVDEAIDPGSVRTNPVPRNQ